MANFKLKGLEELDHMFGQLANIPEKVTESAVAAMAEVAEKKIKAVGERMHVRDPESSVHILDKISHTKIKKSGTGAECYVTFKGSRKRGNTKTTNAEIAFVNEFGHRGQPARPFIKTALTQYADEIAAPAERILGDWIEQTSQG